MAKAATFFKIGELVYSFVIPAARKRRLISSIDPAQVPPELRADYISYQGGIYCFAGSILLILVLPMMIVMAPILGVYGYSRVEKFYPSLEAALNGLFPSGVDHRPFTERWADITAPDQFAQPSAARQKEKISGSGPWVAYVIDADGVEKRLPRRFETDSAAQSYADLQHILLRGKITHAGVIYAPED